MFLIALLQLVTCFYAIEHNPFLCAQFRYAFSSNIDQVCIWRHKVLPRDWFTYSHSIGFTSYGVSVSYRTQSFIYAQFLMLFSSNIDHVLPINPSAKLFFFGDITFFLGTR